MFPRRFIIFIKFGLLTGTPRDVRGRTRDLPVLCATTEIRTANKGKKEFCATIPREYVHPERERDRERQRDREEILIVHPCCRDEKEQMKKLRVVVEMWTRTAEKDFCVIGEGGYCLFENIIRVSFETGIGRLY